VSDKTVSLCFQFVTKGGAVIDTEPEPWPSILEATKRAEELMNLSPGKTISLITFEGDGAVIRAEEIEHAAVMTEEKMRGLYEEAVQLAEAVAHAKG